MLEVDHVDLHYGAAIALRQVSLTAEIGAVTCLMGRNGVGKTSLLRAIVGAHPISAGKITWEGENISKLALYDRARRGIAWVPQGRDIFPLLTVKENLETGFAVLPRGQRKVPDEIYDLFPILKQKRFQAAGELSGGQRQQVAVGRALMTQPKVLMLDEPTAGVSPIVMDELFDRIIEIARSGISILMVEQNARQALEIADKGYVLVQGSNRFTDTGKALLADPEVRRSFLGG